MGGPLCEPVRSTTTKPNTDHDPLPPWRLRAESAHGGGWDWRSRVQTVACPLEGIVGRFVYLDNQACCLVA